MANGSDKACEPAILSSAEPPVDATTEVVESAESPLRPFTWRELTGTVGPPEVRLRLGATHLTADALRTLRSGSVVRLDDSLDEPVEIWAGRHLLGYGCVVLVDGKLAVQVTVRRQPARRASA